MWRRAGNGKRERNPEAGEPRRFPSAPTHRDCNRYGATRQKGGCLTTVPFLHLVVLPLLAANIRVVQRLDIWKREATLGTIIAAL
jgi:hypothetical protein